MILCTAEKPLLIEKRRAYPMWIDFGHEMRGFKDTGSFIVDSQNVNNNNNNSTRLNL